MHLKKLEKLVVAALEDIKGRDIEVLNTTKLTSLFDRVIIASGDSNRQVKALARNVQEKVLEAGAEVLDCQMRGKRRLAYSIAKHREGIYVQLNHNGDGQQVGVLERAMRLSEDVMRDLTVNQDGPMPAPRTVPGVSSEAAPMEPANA